jgi:hypothetical protein
VLLLFDEAFPQHRSVERHSRAFELSKRFTSHLFRLCMITHEPVAGGPFPDLAKSSLKKQGLNQTSLLNSHVVILAMINETVAFTGSCNEKALDILYPAAPQFTAPHCHAVPENSQCFVLVGWSAAPPAATISSFRSRLRLLSMHLMFPFLQGDLLRPS